jgi:imidazolonepropionase-like amidohydrolase
MNRLHRSFVCTAVVLAMPAALQAQALNGEDGPFLIKGGTVVTVSGATMPNTDVLIRDGRIAQVGPNLNGGAGVKEVDARGKFVYPGMFNAYTGLGLAGIGSIQTENLRSEIGDFNPNDRAIVAINVESQMIPITRANGVTHALTAPTGGLMSGQAAVINLAGWTWEDMAVKSSAAFIINYPRTGGGGGRGGGGFGRGGGGGPEQAQQQIRSLKSMLRSASEYEKARAGGATEFDLKLESLRPLMRGETIALVNADAEEQIRGAFMLADSFGLKVGIVGGEEAWKVAAELARRNVPVILGSTESTPAADAPYDAIYAQPGVLVRAGVKIAFSTGDVSSARHVPYSAALAVAYDLPADAALKSLTLWPAQIFGIDSQLGSIETGKLANLFIADGDPLDVRTHMLDVFIAGHRMQHDDRHFELYEKWNARPVKK